MLTLSLLILLELAFRPVLSHPVPCNKPKVRLIHEFPKPSWLENIAVRHNGSILVTELSQPNLYQINPFVQNAEPWLVHTFSGYLGALGIAEIERDVFAVVTGNFSLSVPTSYPGTYTIWKVDMRVSQCASAAHANVEKMVDVPQASFLNGMAYLPKPANSLLLADSDLGLIFRHNLTTNETDVAIDSPLMKKCSKDVLEGINGLRVYGSEIYFTNAYCGTFCRLPIFTNGTARNNSPGEIIARTSSPSYIFDDMAVGPDGTAYVATGTENIVTRILANGVASAFAGDLNSSAIVEPTSMAFGRTQNDSNTIYVTTGGGLGGLLDGTTLLGAQLVAIDL